MTAARIGDLATGAWTRAAGDPVEILERAANGRSVRVQMPPDATFAAKAGRKCWLPASWIDGVDLVSPPAAIVAAPVATTDPYPKCCPSRGQTLPPVERRTK